MKNLFNKTIGGYALISTFVLSLIGMIIYLISGTTGYLAGLAFNVLPIILTIFSLIICLLLFLFSDKLNKIIEEILLFSLVSLLALSCVLFLYSRIDIAADVWFIPVNYPQAEKHTLVVSIVGVVFYMLSTISTIVAGFSKSLTK